MPAPEPCPDHFPDRTAARHIDYREGLDILHWDPEIRAAAEARQEAEIAAKLAAPPCPTCGWKEQGPFVVIRAYDGYAGMGIAPDDAEGAGS